MTRTTLTMSAKRKGTNKYGAKKTVLDGITFDSKMESRYYALLKILQRAGEVADIELQPKFELLPRFKKYGRTFSAITYKPDFLVRYTDGREELIDVKGKQSRDFSLRRKLFDSRYSDMTLRVITLKNGKWIDI